MHFINDTHPIYLHTDASDFGLGGYLFQLTDGKEVPVAFVSKSFTTVQLKWALIQKEVFAIYYCCIFLKTLLRDRVFTIRTDHKNLLFIHENFNPMIVRWFMALSQFKYSYEIEYISGTDNGIAASMSRLSRNYMTELPNVYTKTDILCSNIIEKFRWKNPYDYMRHPLSPNKSLYLTRNGGSTCGFTLGLGDPNKWNECLNVGEHISQWTPCVDSNIHGRAHSSISGSWRREGQDHDSPFCAQWYGYIAPPTPSSLINQNTDPYYQCGTFISPYSMGCFDCPISDDSQGSDTCMCSPANKNLHCGPLWTNLLRGNDTITQGTFLRKGTVQPSTKNAATLSDLAGIQILGDIGDPAASPNDPL